MLQNGYAPQSLKMKASVSFNNYISCQKFAYCLPSCSLFLSLNALPPSSPTTSPQVLPPAPRTGHPQLFFIPSRPLLLHLPTAIHHGAPGGSRHNLLLSQHNLKRCPSRLLAGRQIIPDRPPGPAVDGRVGLEHRQSEFYRSR